MVFPLERRPILANDGAANRRLGVTLAGRARKSGGRILEHAAGESSIRGPALRPAVLILVCLVAAVVAGRLLDRGWASLLGYQPSYEIRGDASEGPHLTHKLVLVVIDGLSLERSRQLRSLNRLRSAGADFDCAGGIPACSSSARATLVSGAWPEVHGVLTEEPRPALSIDNLFRAAGRVGGSRAIAGSASWSSMFGPDLGDAAVLATPMVERRSPFRAAETELLALERQAVQFVVSRQARLGILELNVADLAAREQGARSSEYARASLEADRMLGQLADGLNLWTTTLVVTSDHGQPGQPGMPLVMTGRGMRAGAVGAARQIDVAPTIAALLGLPIPAASQGRVLFEAFDSGPDKVAAVLQRQRVQKQAFARAYAASIGEPAAIQAAGAEVAPDVDALVRSIRAIDDQVDAARQARMNSDRSSRLPVAGVALVAAALALLIVYGRGPRMAPIAGVIGTAAWAAGTVLLEARLGARPLPPAIGCGDVGPLLTRVAAASVVCALFGSGLALALARLRQARSSPAEQCLLGLAPISGAAYVLAMRVAYAYWQQGFSPTWLLGDVGLRLQSLADLARLRAVACAALLVPALAWVAGRVGRSRAPALAILALLAVAGPIEAAGAIYTDVPEHVDASKRYLFYLHGRIVELQGRKAVSPEFGPYEYDAILEALAEPGFEVISEIRPPTTGLEYATKVAAAVRRLLLAKVPADHVTVAGFSKGGGLTLATAAELGEPRVNFVVMAICGGDTASELAGRLKGRMLSIYDASDKLAGSCARWLPQGAAGTSREIVLHVGKGHGTFFTPRKEWLDPLRDWALGK